MIRITRSEPYLDLGRLDLATEQAKGASTQRKLLWLEVSRSDSASPIEQREGRSSVRTNQGPSRLRHEGSFPHEWVFHSDARRRRPWVRFGHRGRTLLSGRMGGRSGRAQRVDHERNRLRLLGRPLAGIGGDFDRLPRESTARHHHRRSRSYDGERRSKGQRASEERAHHQELARRCRGRHGESRTAGRRRAGRGGNGAPHRRPRGRAGSVGSRRIEQEARPGR